VVALQGDLLVFWQVLAGNAERGSERDSHDVFSREPGGRSILVLDFVRRCGFRWSSSR
jgi:hypothetical protein